MVCFFLFHFYIPITYNTRTYAETNYATLRSSQLIPVVPVINPVKQSIPNTMHEMTICYAHEFFESRIQTGHSRHELSLSQEVSDLPQLGAGWNHITKAQSNTGCWQEAEISWGCGPEHLSRAPSCCLGFLTLGGLGPKDTSRKERARLKLHSITSAVLGCQSSPLTQVQRERNTLPLDEEGQSSLAILL